MKNEEDISSDKTENQTQERSLHITTKGTNPRKRTAQQARDHHSNRIMEKELQNGSKMGERGQRRRLIGTERVL